MKKIVFVLTVLLITYPAFIKSQSFPVMPQKDSLRIQFYLRLMDSLQIEFDSLALRVYSDEDTVSQNLCKKYKGSADTLFARLKSFFRSSEKYKLISKYSMELNSGPFLYSHIKYYSDDVRRLASFVKDDANLAFFEEKMIEICR